jgi:hydrogenase maturation factor
LDTILQDELRKFLATLKWVGLQEDVNYPPPDYLGSKMTLAVYVLLEAGFDISEIRKIIRFK